MVKNQECAKKTLTHSPIENCYCLLNLPMNVNSKLKVYHYNN